MKLRLLLIVFALVMVAAACAPPPELRNEGYLQDTSLIDGEPCGPPCWRGIIPGETPWSEARSILEDDPTLSDIEIRNEDETGEIAMTFRRVDGIPCCLLYTENGEEVDQMLFQLAPATTLGQVVEIYGEPEYLSLSEVSDDQAAAALYYPDILSIVYAFVAGKNTGTISADSEIFAVLYVRQGDMDLVVENSSLYIWDGYGSYQDYAGRDFDITPIPTTEGTATDEAEQTDAETGETTPEPEGDEGETGDDDETTPESTATDES
jgi:hypothetical protein